MKPHRRRILIRSAAAAPVDAAAPQPRVAVNFDRPKVSELTMGMRVWGINGVGFDMLGASPLETVKLGTHEVWEFRNEGRAGMVRMAMPHSMHVRGLQFRVIGRSVASRFARGHDKVKAGLVDKGWKDTVLVMPGERVRILLGFADYPGPFLYHCHMLEHGDSGLMRNHLVMATNAVERDNPIAKIAGFAKRQRITGTPTTMQLVAAVAIEGVCSNGASRLPS